MNELVLQQIILALTAGSNALQRENDALRAELRKRDTPPDTEVTK